MRSRDERKEIGVRARIRERGDARRGEGRQGTCMTFSECQFSGKEGGSKEGSQPEEINGIREAIDASSIVPRKPSIRPFLSKADARVTICRAVHIGGIVALTH